MNQLEAMHIYLRVAELASFTQAADSLGLPKANVSEAVKQLESFLGTRLLQRTTRSVQMTQDGLLFYERSKDLLSDMAELHGLFLDEKSSLQGRLRVDLPVGVAKNILIAALPEFLQQHPKIELELSCTDRRVDVIREGFDCVMRVGTLNDSNLIARPLGFLRQINLASPDYLKLCGTPASIDDLQQHFLVHYSSNFGAKSPGFEYQWQGKSQFVKMKGKLTVNNSDAYQAACLAGFGIIQAPQLGAHNLLAQGKLVEILPDFRALSMPVSLLYPDRRHLAKRTQKLMEWMTQTLAPHLQSSPD
ncbi:LysR family transcriptional regulator [Undibacterium flavidum]|uniref:LysR family transcriptional regulator n=1 Tax=Undibacterium flavidum TaxID=2762297 RepID=A0ABR6Y7Z8_9BURK|nr:LysR family transcriptional regulator [Undibacterium flavidum]MBC3872731.1 LysR family transcriptional regulator [Undibacterium flavidum]